MSTISRRAAAAASTFSRVETFHRGLARQTAAHAAPCDFTFGNPHEMPLPGLVAALKAGIEPRRPDWFAYKTSEAGPRAAVAAALAEELGLAFEPEDVALTQGAFGAISVAFRLLMDAGDEAIIPVPGWFCYEPMLHAADLVPVKVALEPVDFGLDLDAIAAAIGPRTRLVIINSPGNPTGRVLPRSELEALAALLDAASDRIGARIWILSDEPYRRIRFDGIGFTSPAAVYPWTLIDYSYGKVLLAPGARLGYLALSPRMPADARADLRAALFAVQMALGWDFPDAVMQYAVPALESVTIDIAALTAKRDRLWTALQALGYRITRPEGAFYLWGSAPGDDALAFAAGLAAQGIFVMPGTLFDRPGHFRLSLTASAEMIERALPHFAAAAGA